MIAAKRDVRELRPARLGYDHYEATDGRGFIIGLDGLTVDGEAFPWPTVGDWILRFTEDGVATLTVAIVVTLPRDQP